MEVTKIYLAGKVAKGAEIGTLADWRYEYENAFASLSDLAPLRFISPDAPDLDESNPLVVFGHDCSLIKSADIVVVDARAKLGVGTAQEMLIAKYFEKYVFTILPRDTHHRRSNLNMHGFIVTDWIHPFIYATSDEIFESIEAFRTWYKVNAQVISFKPPKRIDLIDDAILVFNAHRKFSNNRGLPE